MLAYLIDENIDLVYLQLLRRQQPVLTVRAIGEPGTPAKGTKDPEVLIWCEEYDFVLVTNNRTSMPGHLRDHLSQGRRCPAILILSPGLSMEENIEELLVIAEVALENGVGP